MKLPFIFLLGGFATVSHGSVTVYYPPGQTPLSVANSTGTAAAANYTGAAAYNPTVLNPPDLPSPMPSLNFPIQLQNGGTPGVSIMQTGAFLGFSIEMSVANQVRESLIQVPFLNLMANVIQRAGRVHVRVGGNTQETAVLVDSLPDGKVLEKDITQASNPTLTPPVDFTTDLLYMMRNISAFVDVGWFLGIPFNDTSTFRLGIVSAGEQILGDYLLGFQAGNEPDFYVRHGHRPETYGPYDYKGEVASLIAAMTAQNMRTDILVGPNIAAGDWTPEQVWDTGYVDDFASNLKYLAVEHYPDDNCFAQFGSGTPKDPQTEFGYYLDHNAGKNLIAPFLNSAAYAQTKGKPFLMFETNTASCGGFAGISDSFGAALWGLDYGLQMAHSNFSGALFHVGGQNVFYNPFTPPPTNQSSFHRWTIGPIYYSVLAMAEALGASNSSQVLDLQANSDNIYTPAYGIYENGNPVRVGLFNFMTDASGASDYTANIAISGATLSSVKVKYLRAPSVSTKGNFTWGGQTFGDQFASDGRPMGTEDIQTVQCSNNQCAIKVPAPSFALVFLTDDAQTENDGGPVETFATTAHTKLTNTATIDPAVLATSNGNLGMMDNNKGSTSRGSSGAVGFSVLVPGATMLGLVLGGALLALR
ncbi:glycoside hydrolase family 79 protein [Mycena floridula]|nr:glycoside hydrolase family 79 protein [Mycena floridula]